MSTTRRLIALAALSLSIFAAGCGKPAMVPVQGKVVFKMNDQTGRPTINVPITNGLVVFTPENRGPMAIGRIRDDGTYALYTGDNPGAYPGGYRVTISSLAPGSSSESWGRFEFPRTALPDRYRDADQSRIACDVKASRVNTVDVELTE